MLYLINFNKYKDKTKTQLWNDHKNFFLFWVFGFLFCLILLLSLNISTIIEYSINQSSIKESLIEIFVRNGEENVMKKSHDYWIKWLIDNVFRITLISITIYSLCKAIVEIYKNKTFSKISFWPTVFIFFQAFLGFSSMFGYFFSFTKTSLIQAFQITWANIITFLYGFICTIIWFIFSRNVALIRRIFIYSERIEQLNQFANSTANGSNQNNPYATFFDDSQKNASNANNKNTSNNEYSNNETYKKLNNLTIEQLKEFATKLSISGYENMKKEDLVKIIFEIHSAQEKNSKNKDIEIKDEDEENKK